MDYVVRALRENPELAVFLTLAVGFLIGRLKIGSFSLGTVGQAFNFDGVNDYVEVPSSADIKFGGPFSVEAWINYSGAPTVYSGDAIVTKGADAETSQDWSLVVSENAKLRPHLMVNGGWLYFDCFTTLSAGAWYHVAMVYDGAHLQGYVNGVLDGTTNASGPVQTSDDTLKVGAYAPVNGTASKAFFHGQIDELSLYNRALSPSEIQSIYTAGSGGKCPLPLAPTITAQPTNKTVYVGETATFNVIATGSSPLRYQWLFGGDPLSDKTNPVLTLVNVQLSDAGNYSVIVSNAAGSVTSSNALLTVNLPPPCTPPPSGLISWWRFENDVLDNWDSNNGLTPVGFSFATGKVGKAFNFNQRFVLVPDSPSLRPTNGLTIEAWINPTTISGLTPRTIVAKAEPPTVVGLQIPGLVNYSYYLATTNNGRILFLVSPTGSASADGTIATTDTVPTNQWSLVVATYDGTALRIYLNGSLVAERPYSGGIFPGGSNVGIGAIPVSRATFAWPFAGLIDEVSLYNRALSESEIQAIYNSDFVGKCLVPPTIITQPLSQELPQGEDVLFSVGVLGSRPLRYQWRFDGQNIFRATNSSLIVEKVQSNNIGFYTVLVSNAVGSAISADAALKLLPPLTCTAAPEGMISWWPADGSSVDAMGLNNATLAGASGVYATGKVGLAFSSAERSLRNRACHAALDIAEAVRKFGAGGERSMIPTRIGSFAFAHRPFPANAATMSNGSNKMNHFIRTSWVGVVVLISEARQL